MNKRMTTAMAIKLVKQLTEEKEFWMEQESDSYIYTAAIDEEPLIPEYDFVEMSARLKELDIKIMKIKHSVNVANCTNTIVVNDKEYTIDQVLVRLAQLNKRKDRLDHMRKQLPKKRKNGDVFSSSSIEYQYTNYDIDTVKKEFEHINDMIMTMQMNLDKYNQTVEIDIPI